MHVTSLSEFLFGLSLLLPIFTLFRRGGLHGRLNARLKFVLALLPCVPLLVLLAPQRSTLPGVSAAPTPHYRIRDLGTLKGGDLSVAEGINDRGEIVGISSAADGKYHPFLYVKGKMRDLGVPSDASNGFVSQINADGTVIGNYAYGESCNSPHRAFRYQNGKAEELPMPPDTKSYYAQGINDAGQIVGFGIFTGDKVHSVLWEPHGVVLPIPGLGDEDNGAFGINDHGQIVGIAGSHGYLADSHGVETIGDLGGGISIALSVNTQSQVAGWSTLPNGLIHAFLYQSGKLQDLGTLRGRTDDEISLASTVSASGDVLGLDVERSGDDEYKTRAFLWRKGRMIDLNGCVDAKGYEILRAAAENDKGQIVATAKIDGSYRAVLLTPDKGR